LSHQGVRVVVVRWMELSLKAGRILGKPGETMPRSKAFAGLFALEAQLKPEIPANGATDDGARESMAIVQ
jgi:hypothetical protein